MTVDELLDIEQIRRLRILYSWYLDAGDMDALAALFCEDAVCEFGPYGVWNGRAAIGANYKKTMSSMVAKGPFHSLHVNTNHLVQLTGSDSAVGRLYLVDLALDRGQDINPLIWLGVYDEAYRKTAGRWEIQRTSLQFLWPQRHLSEGFPGDRATASQT